MNGNNCDDKLLICMINNMYNTIKKVLIQINQAQLTQQVSHLIPAQLISFINSSQLSLPMNINHNKLQIYANNIIKINQLCFDHLIQLILQNEQQSSSISTSPKQNNNQKNFTIKDYQSLQQTVQKAQQQVRKHIGIQHQMKICLQQVQQQLSQLIIDNQSLKKQLNFLKKQLSITKKKQLQTIQKLNLANEKLIYYENKLRINNINNKQSKLYTQPLEVNTLINNDTSRKSFKKIFQTNKQKQKSQNKSQQQQQQQNNKRSSLITTNIITKCNKLSSKKQSKLIVLDNNYNDIDNIGLNSFITLSMQKKKYYLYQTQFKNNYINNNNNNNNNNNKEINNNNTTINNLTNNNNNLTNTTNNTNKDTFWNKRLKKKQSTTVNGLYSDINTYKQSNNRSLNISPRQLKNKKFIKQKQLKNVYAINLRHHNHKKQSINLDNNQQTVMKTKNKQKSTKYLITQNNNNNYSKSNNFNQINFSHYLRKNMKIDSNNHHGDRSKSMAY